MENKISVPEKISAFEYVLYQLNEWYKESFPGKENDISILKAMKLLFFVSIIKNRDKEDLLDLFDNFQAWTYGPVEADIYSSYRDLNNIKINRFCLNITNKKSIEDWSKTNPIWTNKIDESIDSLKIENKEILGYDAFTLVEISHYYSSWDFYYNVLEDSHSSMNTEIIRNERKYFRKNSI
ncbi:DUF4065 domain-containing protein [Ornithobacterium rhinotracheale]|uniref:type II toxin-antitoxin system antitoxin SocA domain-containing protein n=1 Tax=Ornithobacterium rhinotracheale TaxID=28251 RepID=UPI00129D120B|nr:type II toxin-antitoxin system antitoxin SocA domain-containing protein [Ornithobacterium rhinotracheale]MRJ07391.1 DUF4065 domain-containing protein [Ornithobacterium rhinotracheale]UOH77987.1 Panacea domain-containing protein [Ornithobacterium rhinotracheale]